MAFGKLYNNSYWPLDAARQIAGGGSADEQYTTIEIFKDSYAGASTEKLLGSNPLNLRLFNEGDSRWKVMKGVQATVELMSETDYEFADIFSAENYTYLCIVHKGLSTGELIQNRSFLANDDSWSLVNMEWNAQSIAITDETLTGSMSQSVTLTNGVSYVFLIDYAESAANDEVIRTEFGASLIDSTVLASSGGRITVNYTHTDPTATDTLKFERRLGISGDLAFTRITNISLLASGGSHSYNPIFVGYSMQDTYIEPERSAPYSVQLTFSNGLGNLKNEDFENAIGDLIGQKQVLDVVNTCLQKTRLYLPVYTGIDIYDIDNDDDGDDPFYEKWVNIAAFDGLNCSEVLTELCEPFQLQVKQVNETWQLVKIANTPYDISAKL